jgi:hypothetical protein
VNALCFFYLLGQPVMPLPKNVPLLSVLFTGLRMTLATYRALQVLASSDTCSSFPAWVLSMGLDCIPQILPTPAASLQAFEVTIPSSGNGFPPTHPRMKRCPPSPPMSPSRCPSVSLQDQAGS